MFLNVVELLRKIAGISVIFRRQIKLNLDISNIMAFTSSSENGTFGLPRLQAG